MRLTVELMLSVLMIVGAHSQGVIIAQAGEFGGWRLYLTALHAPSTGPIRRSVASRGRRLCRELDLGR